MRKLRVIIGCEKSGVIRRAFRALGHDAWSMDLLPADDGDKHHIQDDIRKTLDYGWDAAIFHPPCNFLTVANNGPITHGCKLYTAAQGRRYRDKAIRFFMDCVNAPIPAVCVENPIGIMSTVYRKPDQIIQPFQFGEDASKATCLWLKGLPTLRIDNRWYCKPRMVCECGEVYAYELAFGKGCPACGAEPGLAKPRWGNQTNSGQNKLAPGEGRSAERARTYEKIAEQMALQWSQHLTK